VVTTRLAKPLTLEPDLVALMVDGVTQVSTKATGRMDNRGGVPWPDYIGRGGWHFVVHLPFDDGTGWEAHLFSKQGNRGAMRRPVLKLMVSRTGADIEAATLALYAHCCEELVPGAFGKGEV